MGYLTLPALILVAAAVGPPQPAAGPVRVTFNLTPVEADLKARIEREPNHVSNRIELARLYDAVGSHAAAARPLLQALEIERGPRVYRQLIEHYRRVRRYPLAVPIAVEWSNQDRTDPEPYVHLAALYLYHPAQDVDQRRDLITFGLEHAEKALSIEAAHVPALEIKRQLLAAKWIFADGHERPAIDAEQNALARVFSVARSEGLGSLYPPRRTIRAPSGATPLFVRRNDIPEPARLTIVMPRYPAEAIRAWMQGVVSLEVLIDEAGKVADAWPVRPPRQTTPSAGLHLLEQAALDGIREWRFAPTLVDGKPVPVVLDLIVQFALTLSK